MSLNKDCLWILDILHDGYSARRLLTMPQADLCLQWGCDYAPATVENVESSIVNLFESGLITSVSHDEGLQELSSGRVGVESLSSLESDCYRLTSKGGDVWESWSKPDWSRYMEESWQECAVDDPEMDGMVEFRVASQSRLSEILSKGPGFWGRKLSPQDPICQIEVKRPFVAFYWKSLPMGIECTVPFRWHGEKNVLSAGRDFYIWRQLGFRRAECSLIPE